MRCFLRFQKSPFFGPSSEAVHKHGAVFPIKRKEVFTENESAGWYTAESGNHQNVPCHQQRPCPRALSPWSSRGTARVLPSGSFQPGAVDGARASEGPRWGRVCPGLKAGSTEAPLGRQTILLPELSVGLPETRRDEGRGLWKMVLIQMSCCRRKWVGRGRQNKSGDRQDEGGSGEKPQARPFNSGASADRTPHPHPAGLTPGQVSPQRLVGRAIHVSPGTWNSEELQASTPCAYLSELRASHLGYGKN